MKIAILSLCGTLFLFCGYTYADVVRTTHGLKIEGKIVERTKEKVVIDVAGVAVTYWVEEIEEIIQGDSGGKNFNAASPKNIPELPQSDYYSKIKSRFKIATSDFGAWAFQHRDYFREETQFGYIMEEAIPALQNDDRAGVLKVFERLYDRLTLIHEDWQKMIPPEELREYHETVSAFQEGMLRAIQTEMEEDYDGKVFWAKKWAELDIKGMKLIVQVFIQRDAPDELINSYKKRIAYKEQIIKK